MAGRGRGRGRGRGSGGMYPYVTPLPFVLFPQIELPQVKLDEIDPHMKSLLKRNSSLLNYWKASPYVLEQEDSTDSKKMHIERYSDRNKTTFTRDSLSQILVFSDFPKELVRGAASNNRKKFRWNPESEIKRLDFFEKLEKKNQGREDKGEKEKTEEEEDEDENVEEEEEDEDFDEDYNQNEHFDDDEDDYNDVDEIDDEPTY